MSTITIPDINNIPSDHVISFNEKGLLVVDSSKFDLFKISFLTSNVELEKLDIIYGENTLLSFPLDFTNKLMSVFNKETDSFLYNIPWDTLKIDEIQLFKITGGIKIKLTEKKLVSEKGENKYKKELNAKLYGIGTVLSSENKNKILSSNIDSFEIKYFQNQKLVIEKNSEKSIDFEFWGSSKGIFLDNIDMSQINRITINFGQFVRFDYDKDMLVLLTEKVTSSCYYLSFDDKPYCDKNWESSVNFTGLEGNGSKVNIQFDSDINQTVNIRVMVYNELVYKHNGIFIKYHI